MRYKEFATEALAPSEYRPLVKGWDKAKYAELFGGQYRIYIPLETPEPVTKTVKINPQVKQEVEKLGYTIEDYLKGIAVKTENGRVRQIKIGKLLSPATSKIFANDPVRGATRQSKQIVVISRHPYDIAGMSTDRGWTSCMNLRKSDNNTHYIPLDIKAGTVIAYLINANDKNIKSPQARILIKPFVNILGNHEVAFGIENKLYGTAPPEFSKTVEAWADKINASHQLNGIFKLDPNVYPDDENKRNYRFIGKLGADEDDSSLKSQLQSVDKNPSFIKTIISSGVTPHELVQQIAVTKDPDLLKDIIRAGIKPSEAVQKIAVRLYVLALKHIIGAGIKPSEAVQKIAVSKFMNAIPSLIEADIEISEEVQEAAVLYSPHRLTDLIKAGITPCEKAQIAAVSQQAYLLNYMMSEANIKPSEAVQLAAVKRDGKAIRYIIKAGIKPSEAVQIAALTRFYTRSDVIDYLADAGIELSNSVKQAAGIQ